LVLIFHYLTAFTGVFTAGSLFSDILRSTGVIFLTYLFIFIFILNELLNKRDWVLAKRSTAVSAAVFAVLTFFGLDGIGVSGKFLTVDLGTSGLSIGNTTFAGAFLLLSLIITLVELARSRNTKEKYFFASLALVQLVSPLLLSFDLWTGSVSMSDPVSFLGEARSSSATAWLLVLFLGGAWVLRRYIPVVHKARVFGVYAVLWVLIILGMIGFLFNFLRIFFIESHKY